MPPVNVYEVGDCQVIISDFPALKVAVPGASILYVPQHPGQQPQHKQQKQPGPPEMTVRSELKVNCMKKQHGAPDCVYQPIWISSTRPSIGPRAMPCGCGASVCAAAIGITVPMTTAP